MQRTLNPIEQFLLDLEQSERTVFSQYPDYLIYPVVPFFQLVHVCNLEQVIEQLNRFQSVLGGYLIRADGYLAFTCPEFRVREDDLRRLTLQLLEIMRF
ncbi:hypothetical protein L1D61_25700 [Vibrio mediterranei]|uniref:Uncharacterized protein n=1 Tax=Vibrio mediterranei TaxID=689 RepID=A0A3G4VQ83_9VIBR|nr:hypothetical protein [Vibrio mediterranei]AYV25041.1 hypothetical protein ECB94_27445 [Vibrio mediterranei]MCG9790539.1 hypothetical protein [Vibrio mediterranei]